MDRHVALATIPVNIAWSFGGTPPGANVWHVRADELGLDAWEDQVGWVRDFYDDIKEAFHAGVVISFDGNLSPVNDDDSGGITAPPWSITGTGGGDALDPGLAILVRWQCATGGRKGRGRTFLGPLSEGLNGANGVITDSALDLVATAAADVVEKSDSASNGALGVLSRKDGLFRDFVSSSVAKEFSYLRGRAK